MMPKVQSDERIKQMSKQEEVLLKRKQEIERKLKSQYTAKDVFDEKPKFTPCDRRESSSTNNIFNNDGSFLEQFKKIAKSPHSADDPDPRLSQYNDGDGDEKSSDQFNLYMQTKNEEASIEYVKSESVKAEDVDPSQSDWFQDALKRAKEKAKEITSCPSPSSSSSSVSPSDKGDVETKKRKSRWGEKVQQTPPVVIPPVLPAPPQQMTQQINFSMPNMVLDMVGEGQHMEAIQGVMITKLTRNNPAIINYAMKVFATIDLTDAQWKQCEEQMKMNIVFQLLQDKKNEAERLEARGKVKYEYDSDEDVDGGTWEHKRRKREMQETAIKADVLTKGAEGKHHIGDFLPPEELAAFMEKYTALKEGRDPDLSDYRENRITEDNIGYKMLKSMGWTEGTGLGAEGKGITNPVNQKGKSENQGLGAATVNNLTVDDDEYDAYRKRMMLAYRFRPNPLNNPRRAYY